jgi:hypothetical protein
MMTVPADTPITTPPDDIVALAVLLLFHVPPVTLAVKVVVLPAQTVSGPEIAAGGVPEVMTFVAMAVPQLLLIV